LPFLNDRGGRRFTRRKLDMRFPAFAVLAFVASGCTIHVVEQPASPVMVAEAPPLVRVRPARPQPVVYVPVASPAPVATPTPVATRPSLARPPNRDRPHVAMPAPRPSRIPFNTTTPEARSPHLASVAPPTKHRRPQKVKQDEPVTLVSSTSVAKTQ
jgi:hypothetical protein